MTALAVNTCAAKLDDLAAYFGASGHARDRRADGRQRATTPPLQRAGTSGRLLLGKS